MSFLRRPQNCPGGEKRLLFGDEQSEHQADPRWSPLPAEGHHAAGLRTGSSSPSKFSLCHLVCGSSFCLNFLLSFISKQYMMVKEALHERANLLEIAPHLSAPLPIMLPVYKYDLRNRKNAQQTKTLSNFNLNFQDGGSCLTTGPGSRCTTWWPGSRT